MLDKIDCPALDVLEDWVVAHVAALDASDVLVVLGGGSGTRLAEQLQWSAIGMVVASVLITNTLQSSAAVAASVSAAPSMRDVRAYL
jgi:predicted Rossmann-fold nucleotide-binding protein